MKFEQPDLIILGKQAMDLGQVVDEPDFSPVGAALWRNPYLLLDPALLRAPRRGELE